jgi:hypothetical protein
VASRRSRHQPRPGLDIGGIDPLAAVPTAAERGAVTGTLLRFISCGLLALFGGLVWRLTLAPHQIGVVSAMAGIMALLVGFIAGGAGWYAHDVRLRQRSPGRVSDERLFFSFIVFAVMPCAVLLLIAVVWVVALLIGSS